MPTAPGIAGLERGPCHSPAIATAACPLWPQKGLSGLLPLLQLLPWAVQPQAWDEMKVCWLPCRQIAWHDKNQAEHHPVQGKRRDKLKLVHLQPAGKYPEGVCSQQSSVSSLAWYRSCNTACIAALTWNAGGHTVYCLCESLQVQRHGSCAILCKGRYVCYNYKVGGSGPPPSLSSLPSVPTAGPVPGELSVVVAYSVASGAGVLQMFLRMPQTGGALLRLWDDRGSKELHTSFAGTFARHGVNQKLPSTLQPVPHYCIPHFTLVHMNAVSAELPVLWRSAKATVTRRSEQNLCTQGCSVSYSIFRLSQPRTVQWGR